MKDEANTKYFLKMVTAALLSHVVCCVVVFLTPVRAAVAATHSLTVLLQRVVQIVIFPH